MKNFYLSLLLLLGFTNYLPAQIVNIPDANFKAKLLVPSIDTNWDGQIQQSEADAVHYLYLQYSNISSLVGIQSFTNLRELYCHGNNLTSLDVSGMASLEELVCDDNHLQSLVLNGCAGLKVLYFYNNQITNIDLSSCTNIINLWSAKNPLMNLDVSALVNLKELHCFQNQLTQLDVTACTNLTFLWCAENSLNSLDVSTLVNLKELHCHKNQITSLDVSNLINLDSLNCFENQLTSLNFGNLTGLEYISCSNNFLTTLNVSPFTNLAFLNCYHNQISSLDITPLNQLIYLFCGVNPISYLDLSACTALKSLSCGLTQLSSLDVSACTNLSELRCGDNLLVSMNIKNGKAEKILEFFNNPNLQYICADANQIAKVQQLTLQYGFNGVNINTLCTSSPLGNYNTILGSSVYDADTNGCTASDSTFSHLLLKVINGLDTGYVFANEIGNYSVFLDSGNYTLSPQFQNAPYFSVSPSVANIYFPDDSNHVQMQDFCITANGIFPDVEVLLFSIYPAIPGFSTSYKLLFHNRGTTLLSGDIVLDFMGNKLHFDSASIAPVLQNSNQLTWNYMDLLPSEWRSIDFKMSVYAPPINNIGDSLNFTATSPLANDSNLADNSFLFDQMLIGAFDPNDIRCLEGKQVSATKIGDYLHYLVRFQNTGTYYAQNVRLMDKIDASKFDISTFQLIEASHNVTTKIENNTLLFYFDGIMLPDSFTNEPLSHGYILFKLKTKANLPLYTEVENKAEIYFDFNLPVITNTAITTLGIADVAESLPFKCYPNPAQMTLNVVVEQATDFVILNSLGEPLLTKRVFLQESIDISALTNGIYYLIDKNKGIGKAFVKCK